jgi:hypothetical protein
MVSAMMMVMMMMPSQSRFADHFLSCTGIIGLQHGYRVRNGCKQLPIVRGGSKFRLRGRCGLGAAGGGQHGRGSEQSGDLLVHAWSSRDLDYLSKWLPIIPIKS